MGLAHMLYNRCVLERSGTFGFDIGASRTSSHAPTPSSKTQPCRSNSLTISIDRTPLNLYLNPITPLAQMPASTLASYISRVIRRCGRTTRKAPSLERVTDFGCQFSKAFLASAIALEPSKAALATGITEARKTKKNRILSPLEAMIVSISRKSTSFKRNSDVVTRSSRWKALRLIALRRDEFKCVKCGVRGRLEVDHIKPVRDAPELAFALDNLQALCAPCHTRKTRIECGHAPPSPERLAWRAAVKQLTEHRRQYKC